MATTDTVEPHETDPSLAGQGEQHRARVTGVIDCAAYAGGWRQSDFEIDDISEVLKHDDRFIWIGLFEPSEPLLRKVQEEFGLHDLAIEDAHAAHQRPKIERYLDSLFVVLRTARTVGDDRRLEFGETHIFVGARYIVTVRHGSLRSHVGLRARCESIPDQLSQGPGFVLYALMDFVVDQYFPIVEALEEELEEIEEQIFGAKYSRQTTSRIYSLKRDLLALKRAVSPLVDVCNRLVRFEDELIPAETRPYFRDVYDHVVRINDNIDTVRELLGTALEANLSLVSVSQNEDTKRLAAWAAIIAIPTMLAGIYGMNFDQMPELRWWYGYPVVLGVMVACCVTLYIGFKRSHWL
jgi:magnesium transporter